MTIQEQITDEVKKQLQPIVDEIKNLKPGEEQKPGEDDFSNGVKEYLGIKTTTDDDLDGASDMVKKYVQEKRENNNPFGGKNI